MLRFAFALLASAAVGLAGHAQAQTATWPSQPVNIVIPLAAGTGMDALVRAYADQLQIALAKPVVVRNEPGASFMLAPSTVSKAAPDGHTLLATVSSTLVVNQTLYKSIPYDPKSFIPISYYVKSPFVLVVGSKSPYKTAADLLAAARNKTPSLTYASLGAGTSQNLGVELIKQRFGVNMMEVPYRATPQQITDIASGQVDLGLVEAAASQGLIQDGQLRALAVSSSQRFRLYPDVPTIAEALNAPDLEAVSWHMLLAPAGTPRAIVDRLHEEMKRITRSPEFLDRANKLGLLPIESPPVEEIQSFIEKESQKWGDLLRKSGLAGSQ